MMLKNLQIGLHALFLNEKVRTLQNVFFSGCHIQQLITPEVFVIEACCLQLKWSVNCHLETCYFYLK